MVVKCLKKDLNRNESYTNNMQGHFTSLKDIRRRFHICIENFNLMAIHSEDTSHPKENLFSLVFYVRNFFMI